MTPLFKVALYLKRCVESKIETVSMPAAGDMWRKM